MCQAITRTALAGTLASVPDYAHAIQLARDIGAKYEECQALLGLATVHIHHDHAKEAHTSASQALALASECGYQLLERQARAITS